MQKFVLVSPSAWELKILVWKRRHFELKPLAPVYPYISIWIIKFLSLLDFVNWRRIIYFRLNRLWSTSPQSENSRQRWLFAEISHPTKNPKRIPEIKNPQFPGFQSPGLRKKWCGGARETHWATCHNRVSPSKTKEFLKSPCFFRSLWYYYLLASKS